MHTSGLIVEKCHAYKRTECREKLSARQPQVWCIRQQHGIDRNATLLRRGRGGGRGGTEGEGKQGEVLEFATGH